jgi:[ribosomal protein S5]-alanine N-acetyltransferase
VPPVRRRSNNSHARGFVATREFVTDSTTAEDHKRLPSLGSGDFRLRRVRHGDEAALLEYLSRPEVIAHTSIPVPNLGSLTASVQRDIDGYANNRSFRYAIAAADDRVIGVCGFTTWSPDHQHAELGYELTPQYWGQGVMRRAVVAMLSWGFSELGLNRVHAFVMTSNDRSIRLLERCGFSREGTLRQYRIARGEPKDFHLYALLAEDFANAVA